MGIATETEIYRAFVEFLDTKDKDSMITLENIDLTHVGGGHEPHRFYHREKRGAGASHVLPAPPPQARFSPSVHTRAYQTD
ncbi:hypothetical protein DFAR_3720011 [Desulfarculales bacterium]